MVSAINDDKPDSTDIKTAHYIEINDSINFMTTSQCKLKPIILHLFKILNRLRAYLNEHLQLNS